MTFRDRFAARRAVITGGASGIGLEVARRLATEGASVCLWDIDAAGLDRAVTALGDGAMSAKVDIASWDEVAHAAGRAAERMGGIDILVASGIGIADRAVEAAASTASWRPLAFDAFLPCLLPCCCATFIAPIAGV